MLTYILEIQSVFCDLPWGLVKIQNLSPTLDLLNQTFNFNKSADPEMTHHWVPQALISFEGRTKGQKAWEFRSELINIINMS